MNMFLNKKAVSLLLSIFWGMFAIFNITTNAFAQPDVSRTSSLKQVEIIVFSKVQATALLSERWEMPTKVPDVSRAIKLLPFNETNKGNLSPQELTPTHWKLNKISNRLSKNGYTIILHDAWVQDFSQELNPIDLFSPEQLPLTPTIVMNGTINITLNRYFNVAIDLLFGEPVDLLTPTISPEALEKNFHNIANGIAYFHLKQNRRMKSDELNYIDHPLYGVLIKIIPFTPSTSYSR